MIQLKKNKLNLVIGKVDSAKTTLILNEVSDYLNKDKEVVFFSPDTKSYHIEKKMHSLLNDVDISSVKHDRKTLEPVGLRLPSNFMVIDSCNSFDGIFSVINEFRRGTNPDLIVLDNLNQIDYRLDLPYKERISDLFIKLNKMAETMKITILASFYMLSIANWENDDFYTENDDELGAFILVQRENRDVLVYEEMIDKEQKFKISPRNLSLESVIKPNIGDNTLLPAIVEPV